MAKLCGLGQVLCYIFTVRISFMGELLLSSEYYEKIMQDLIEYDGADDDDLNDSEKDFQLNLLSLIFPIRRMKMLILHMDHILKSVEEIRFMPFRDNWNGNWNESNLFPRFAIGGICKMLFHTRLCQCSRNKLSFSGDNLK